MAAINAAVPATNSAANSAARRKDSERVNLVGRNQLVPRAAYRLDGIDDEAMVELGAQPADVALHHVGMRIEVYVPDALQQHLAGHGSIEVFRQVLEQLEFLRHQFDADARAGHGAL